MSKTMQDYANIGSAVLTGNPAYVRPMFGQALRARNQASGLRALAAYAVPTTDTRSISEGSGPTVGFTMPSLTFDKMRQINGSALSLNFDIEKNVARQSFKDAWNRWFADWQHFFERYQGFWAKAGSLIDSDALALQTESYRKDLVGDPKATPRPNPGWIGNYLAEKTPEGQAVPPTSAAEIDPEPQPGAPPGQKDAPEEGLPWWVVSLLVVGGVSVVAGTVFIIRRKVIEAETARHMLEHDVLPVVLGSAMGPTGVAFAHAAANSRDRPTAHDPSAFMGVPPHGRVYFVG